MATPDPTKDTTRRCSERERSGAGGIASGWADLAKACSIYTPGHHRVHQCLAALMPLVTERLAAGPLSITFTSDKATVGTDEVGLSDRANVLWLRERLDRSLLAGVELAYGVTADSLLAFTRSVLEKSQQRQREPTFDDLWSETYDGVRPLPRRYDNVFLGAGGGESSQSAATNRNLYQMVESSPVIQERIDRFEDVLAAIVTRETPGQEKLALDLLAEILRQMPVEARVEEPRIVELTATILDAMTTELQARCSTGIAADRLAIEQVMHSISRKYFFDATGSTHAVPTEAEKQALAEGEAARKDLDDRVTDDVSALLSELAGLADMKLDLRREAELPQEQLGVYLHFLIHSKPGEQTVRLHPVLRRLLIDANQEKLDCLQSYLEYAEQLALDVDDWTYLDNITSFLVASNLVPLIRRCGYFAVPRLRRLFPRLFLTYLSTIDWRQQDEVTTFEQLCALLGPETILRHRDELLAGNGLRQGGLDLRLLALPRPAFLPFVSLILTESGEARSAAAAAFLARALPQTRETALLHLWPDPATLPVEYLALLAQRSPAATYPPALYGVVVRLTRRLIEATAGNPDAVELRSQAIRLLGELGAREQRPFLLEILRARRMLGLPREPRPVREAAREAILRLGAGQEACAK